MSSIGWIDFSSEHRARVRTVLDMLKSPGVVDELGIGVIRDSFADQLFPGVSTIQTRAKYFTLTAILIREYEKRTAAQKRKQSLEDYLAQEEKACRIQFARTYKDNSEGLGIIGITFGEQTDRDVQRLPSSVYWNGLRTFGIVRRDESLPEFSRYLSGVRSLKSVFGGNDRLKGDDPDADEDAGPRVLVPEVNDDYRENLSIMLTNSEATFLREQITANVAGSLLGQILLDAAAMRQFLDLPNSATFADMSRLLFIRHLKESLRKTVEHARSFWEIFEGAHIRYNVLLQQKRENSESLDSLVERWLEWRSTIGKFDWSNWDTEFLWQLVHEHGGHVREETRRFVNVWIDQARNGGGDSAACDKAVIEQEKMNKGGRARLPPGVVDTSEGKWIGLKVLNYRLPQGRTLIEDIDRGGEADANAGR